MESVLPFPSSRPPNGFLDRVTLDFATSDSVGADFVVVLELWGQQSPSAADTLVTLSSGRRLAARMINLTTGEIHRPYCGLPGEGSAPSPSRSRAAAPGESA